MNPSPTPQAAEGDRLIDRLRDRRDMDGFDNVPDPLCLEAASRLELYRDIFAEICAKATPIEFDQADHGRILAYRVPCGPLHRAAGRLGFQMFDGEAYLAAARARIEELERQVREEREACAKAVREAVEQYQIDLIVDFERTKTVDLAALLEAAIHNRSLQDA